jgi:hypothetical protein
MKYGACLLVAFACSGAFASEPGQPLSPEDFVLALPGLSATTVLLVLPLGWGRNGFRFGRVAFDVEGNQYTFREEQFGACGGTAFHRHHLFHLRPDATEDEVAYMTDRCFNPNIPAWG